MQTLSYGYKVPESGDKGSTLWTALEDDITRVNGHTHNGTDSALLPIQSLTTTKQSISHTDWANYSGPTGHVRQLVSIPSGFTYDDFTIDFRDATSGAKLYPTIERVNNTSYYIYSIDDSLDVTAVYGT